MIMSISFVCPYENKFSTTIQNKSSMFFQNILTIIENIINNFSHPEWKEGIEGKESAESREGKEVRVFRLEKKLFLIVG